MAGSAQHIFGRGKFQFPASESVSLKDYFQDFAPFDYIKFFLATIFEYDPLRRYRVEIKYHFSNEFLKSNDKVLQDLIEDQKHLVDNENLIEAPTPKTLQTSSLTTSNLSSSTFHEVPSSKKLLSKPWLIKIQTNTDGKPPTLKCYGIDEEGEIIEVEGKPSLIPPILGPEAKQEVWKPKEWKPIRQTLKLHEITPSPKCPKHQHLQESKRYELIRETLLQATITTTNKEKERSQLHKEFSQDCFNSRLKKLSNNPNSDCEPPKWSLPEVGEEKIEVKLDDSVKENENSSTTESSSENSSTSSIEKGISSHRSKDKQKQEEERKKRLEEKKKEKLKKKKIQDEKRRKWRAALREAAGQAGFMGTYATRVGGLGRPF